MPPHKGASNVLVFGYLLSMQWRVYGGCSASLVVNASRSRYGRQNCETLPEAKWRRLLSCWVSFQPRTAEPLPTAFYGVCIHAQW
jgi:hypothetical protein